MSDKNQNAGASAENTATETAATEAPAKEKAPPKEIIRGRMPVAIVALARFGKMKDQGTKAKADAFGTTVGKIDDIVKNRNFAYVDANFRPTEAQKADGKAWLERHPTGAADLLAELEAVEVATPEQAAAFEATRSANRGQPSSTKDGEAVVDAGGGNRKGKKDKGAAAPAAGTGEALLA
jgi:hypothetical protein